MHDVVVDDDDGALVNISIEKCMSVCVCALQVQDLFIVA